MICFFMRLDTIVDLIHTKKAEPNRNSDKGILTEEINMVAFSTSTHKTTTLNNS